ncbi:50S ribosomal protein L23 [Candidatus Jorgensenbacteria bacterium]|nr:50S ribosomal protein L23 [Candidatus Jorgensenbacteria bacterium]
MVKSPHLSEKAHNLHSELQYTFMVDIHANKSTVKKEVEIRYGVKARRVRIVRMQGKTKRVGFTEGQRSDFKKAIVTLKKGEKLEIT